MTADHHQVRASPCAAASHSAPVLTCSRSFMLQVAAGARPQGSTRTSMCIWTRRKAWQSSEWGGLTTRGLRSVCTWASRGAARVKVMGDECVVRAIQLYGLRGCPSDLERLVRCEYGLCRRGSCRALRRRRPRWTGRLREITAQCGDGSEGSAPVCVVLMIVRDAPKH